MNFETRYLIRWGIPGWILILSLYIQYLIINPNWINVFTNESSAAILGTTVVLAVVGIPVGYLLNQIHHIYTWVIRVDWDEYFNMENELTNIFLNHKQGEKIRERYRYLLTRIHELGGIFIALLIVLSISIYNLIFDSMYKSTSFWIYFVVIILVTICIYLSRNYYSRNHDALTANLVCKEYKTVKNWFWFIKR